MEKELRITIPEGYEIDNENSTFEVIKFKKKPCGKYRDTITTVEGYCISSYGEIYKNEVRFARPTKQCVFYDEKVAKSARAMAQISQIMANDERFGGPITDDEWNNDSIKYILVNNCGTIHGVSYLYHRWFLSFHTPEQLHLFLKENRDLVKDYLMID